MIFNDDEFNSAVKVAIKAAADLAFIAPPSAGGVAPIAIGASLLPRFGGFFAVAGCVYYSSGPPREWQRGNRRNDGHAYAKTGVRGNDDFGNFVFGYCCCRELRM